MTVAFQVPNPPPVGLGGFNSTRQRAGIAVEQPPVELGNRAVAVKGFLVGGVVVVPAAPSLPTQHWSG
ncbi:MAG: hypothetical protein HQL96_10870 [Magnetococcales bacterium]|nr:hypothetical protein [Magnetococcales bacterium]